MYQLDDEYMSSLVLVDTSGTHVDISDVLLSVMDVEQRHFQRGMGSITSLYRF
jgi:hypothetical protein